MRYYIYSLNMLIEILGNSSSLLVILLIGLAIYFGIQAKTKKLKWRLVICILTKAANQHVSMLKKQKSNQKDGW